MQVHESLMAGRPPAKELFDADLTFPLPRSYAAYIQRSNEKELLQALFDSALVRGMLPLRLDGGFGKRILDLGCGLGTHTSFLAERFPEAQIHAIDRQDAQVRYSSRAVAPRYSNVRLERTAFEDWSPHSYDFILASHVLQYIDTDRKQFVEKILGSLRLGGQAWLVLQRRKGLNQYVRVARRAVQSQPRYFRRWFVCEDLEQELESWGMLAKTVSFASSFRSPSLDNLTAADENFLDFLLLGQFVFNRGRIIKVLKRHCGFGVSGERVRHDVGVIVLQR